jgi:hypothetical protein
MLLVQQSGCHRSEPNLEHDPRKFTPETRADADLRSSIIREELATLQDHPWAGEYRQFGTAVNLHLLVAPRSGFVYTWHGCLGMYDLNYGPASPTKDGAVALYCEFKNNEWGARGLPDRLYPVQWGERRYLLADDEIAEFRECVRLGYESRTPQRFSGRFLLRVGDEAKPAEGEPKLPTSSAALQ